MGILKPNYTGSVIKIFKIATYDTCQVSVSELVNFLNGFLSKCTEEKLIRIYKNYNSKHLSVNRFFEYINDSKNIIANLIINWSKSSTIFYDNNLLNKTEEYKKSKQYKMDIDLISLYIHLNNYFINETDVICFVDNIYKIINFDYGYVFYLQNKQDVITEKAGVFSQKLPYDINNKLKNIKEGYVFKLYKYNMLNEIQVKTLNVNAQKINNNLYLYKENNK
jgi:hypothetical protein